ncbi:hypothetical protein [Methylorubrum extorquens]|uniref:hypothetical protein n=1 Tax=Methylorubrum extorquens TaxID=408 RepID=UPI001EE5DFB2|nr:hypothetical protein [Methylorubrum extorquens]MCG5246943.1 hypothetical protein [Methylorubrum extorquens]
MVAAGFSAEQIATVVKAELVADQARVAKADEARRAKAAEKKRRQRAVKVDASPNIPGTHGDNRGQPGTHGDSPSLDGLPLPQTPTPSLNPSHSDPDGSASPSGEPRSAEIIDPRKDLFGRGLATVRRMTGRADPGCRTLLGKWLRNAGDSAVVVMAAIDTTEAAEPANPIPYVEAIIAREAKRNGSGSHDTFGRGAAGNRYGGSSFDAVATGLARVAARRGLGSGGRANGGGSGHAADHGTRRDDPGIEDADWTAADGDSSAHRRPAGRH